MKIFRMIGFILGFCHILWAIDLSIAPSSSPAGTLLADGTLFVPNVDTPDEPRRALWIKNGELQYEYYYLPGFTLAPPIVLKDGHTLVAHANSRLWWLRNGKRLYTTNHLTHFDAQHERFAYLLSDGETVVAKDSTNILWFKDGIVQNTFACFDCSLGGLTSDAETMVIFSHRENKVYWVKAGVKIHEFVSKDNLTPVFLLGDEETVATSAYNRLMWLRNGVLVNEVTPPFKSDGWLAATARGDGPETMVSAVYRKYPESEAGPIILQWSHPGSFLFETAVTPLDRDHALSFGDNLIMIGKSGFYPQIQWFRNGSLLVHRNAHGATLLGDRKTVVVGANGGDNTLYWLVDGVEVASFVMAPKMTPSSSLDGYVTVMPDGQTIIARGVDRTFWLNNGFLISEYIW